MVNYAEQAKHSDLYNWKMQAGSITISPEMAKDWIKPVKYWSSPITQPAWWGQMAEHGFLVTEDNWKEMELHWMQLKKIGVIE